ncbi:hypothetical protein [Nocardioides sp. NPDC127503]|uniref:hypothetical protein n=1 Tax=Nocardioides sp. NPDC127503 TaxID=3154516 RepID=UPI00331E041F
MTQSAWDRYVVALAHPLTEIGFTPSPSPDDFVRTREWIEWLLEARRQVHSLLWSMEPFTPFNGLQAAHLQSVTDGLLEAAADAVESGAPPEVRLDQFQDAAAWWSERKAHSNAEEALQSAFGVDGPVVDEIGEFRPDWVLNAYAYRHNELLRLLLPHLASLGLPNITDLLVGTSVVGSILNCHDPISAYTDMDVFVTFFLSAQPGIATKVRNHLERLEPSMRRARRSSAEAWIQVAEDSETLERRALALATSYKRLVEGPFRQFIWARHCLLNGKWEVPPTLTSLRERLISSSDNRDVAAAHVVIPEVRNSEAHETLHWDGIRETYVTENGDVSAHDVYAARLAADSMARGYEAAFTAMRSIITPSVGVDNPLPAANDVGRMPAWQRVQAFFGTNRLRLLEAELNTRHPTFRVEHLGYVNINPCFQALVLAHRLLPDAETYSVSAPSLREPLVVSAEALTATGLVWEYAVSNLDQMPLSTFLPANLDSRVHVEASDLAIRSAAWIAADDAVGVIDGSNSLWDGATRQLLDVRLQVVELAVAQAIGSLEATTGRLASVRASVEELRRWLTSSHPNKARLAETQPAMKRLRTQWERWGPVSRHPLLLEQEPDAQPERQPRLREPYDSMAYRII